MEDSNVLTQSSKLCSEDGAGPCSHRWQTETENRWYELLTRKMENSVVEAELTTERPTRSQLDHEDMEKEEPGSFRVPLQQKEKKKDHEILKTQLPRKDEICVEKIENQQYDRALRILLVKLRWALKQLQEEQDRQREGVQNSQQMQDRLQRFQIECSKAKALIKEQGKKIEELQKLGTNLTGDKEEQLKKLTKFTQSLKCSLDQKKNKNEELEEELTKFKKHLKVMRKKLNEHENGEFSCREYLKTKELEVDISVDMLKNEIHDLKEKWGTINSKYLPLNIHFKYIDQELLSIKVAQKQCDKLHKDQKTLEREVLDLQRQIQENMTKSEDERNAKTSRDNSNNSALSQLEHRIANLESGLAQMVAEEISNERKVERYKRCFLEEQKLSKLLSQKLNKTNNKLSKVRTDVLLVKEWNRTMQNVLSTKPVPKRPGLAKHDLSIKCSPSLIPSRGPIPPAAHSRPSPQSVRKNLLKKQQKLMTHITEEVNQAAAELVSWSFENCPSGSR